MKKTILSIILFFFTFLSLDSAYSEITSKELLNQIFVGCVEEDTEDTFSAGQQFKYCGCAVEKISKQMEVEEVMYLGLDMLKAENEDERDKIIFSNDKFSTIIVQCVSDLFE